MVRYTVANLNTISKFAVELFQSKDLIKVNSLTKQYNRHNLDQFKVNYRDTVQQLVMDNLELLEKDDM